MGQPVSHSLGMLGSATIPSPSGALSSVSGGDSETQKLSGDKIEAPLHKD